MIVPGSRTVFEGLSSKEYYRRQRDLIKDRFNGGVHLVFDGFEGLIIYVSGEAIVALEEASRWMRLGKELIEPLENKAVTNDGKMSAYELSGNMLSIFTNKKMAMPIETEMGQYLTVASMLKSLKAEKSTGILRIKDPSSTAYIFLLNGVVAGAGYVTYREKLHGDAAIRAAETAAVKGKATATIFYIEETLESKALPPVPGAAPKEEVKLLMPPEPAKTQPSPPSISITGIAKPVEPVTKPDSGVRPMPAVKTAPATTARPEPALPDVKTLTVVTSVDKSIRLKHRDRQSMQEALEEHDVAWMGASTIKALGLKEGAGATIETPQGKKQPVKIKEAQGLSGGPIVIVPAKLRKQLYLDVGAKVSIRP